VTLDVVTNNAKLEVRCTFNLLGGEREYR